MPFLRVSVFSFFLSKNKTREFFKISNSFPFIQIGKAKKPDLIGIFFREENGMGFT